jgi:hypothetical protein
MNQVCDRDHVYIPKFTEEDRKKKLSPKMTELQAEALKPLRKHDKVRKNPLENMKLQRIEQELLESS